MVTGAASAAVDFDIRLDPAVAAPGEQVLVELTLTNTGTLPENDLRIDLEYPAGLSALDEQLVLGAFNRAASCAIGSFNQSICTAGEPMIWTIDSLNPGQASVSTFPVVVSGDTASGTMMSFAATVSQDSVDVGADTTELEVDDLSVATLTIDSDNDPAAPGETIRYTVSYGNRANGNLTSGNLTLTLPPTLNFVAASDGGTFAAGQVSWPLGTVPAASVGQRTVEVTVPAGSGGGTLLPLESELTGAVSGLPRQARSEHTGYVGGGSSLDLSVDVNPFTATPGEQVLVSMKLTNTGTLPILDSQVLLRHPQHVSSVSEQVILGRDAAASCAVGSFNQGTCETNEFIVFNVPALNPGFTQEFTMPVPVQGVPGDLVRFQARLIETGFVAWETVTVPVVQSSPLNLAIEPDKDPVQANDVVTYTLHYANRSSGNVTGTNLKFELPPNTTLLSTTPGAAINGDQVSWSLGTLPASFVGQEQLVVRAAQGTPGGTLLPVRSSIAGSANFLPTVQRAANTIFVGNAGALNVEMDLNTAPALPGERVMVSIKVANNGVLPVLGSQVLLRFPTQVSALNEAFILGEDAAASCAVGSFDQGICTGNEYLIFNIDALNPGRASEFRIPIVVAAGAPAGSLIRLDARVRDGDGVQAWERRVLPVDPNAVVNIGISQDSDPVAPGDALVYTVDYANTQNGNVTDGALVVTLPEGVTFVSATGGGVAQDNAVTWSLGTVTGQTLGRQRINVMVDSGLSAGDVLAADAQIAGSFNFRPTVRRAEATAYVGDRGPLALGLDLGALPAQAGEQIMLTLKVSNTSAFPVLGGQVLLRYPGGLNATLEQIILGENSGASCAVGSFDQGTCTTGEFLVFDVDGLAPGNAREFTVPVTPASGTSTGRLIDFHARVLDGEGVESWEKIRLPVNNQEVLTLAIDPRLDPVAAGARQNYVIRYGNSATGNVTDAVLRFELPTGSEFESASAGGQHSDGVVTWALGTLIGESIGQRSVTVRAPASGPLGSVQSGVADLQGVFNFAPARRIASTGTTVGNGGPLGFNLAVTPVPGVPNQTLNVTMTVTNNSNQPVLGSQVLMQFPLGINSLSESAIEGGLDAAASCAVGSFNQSICSGNEFMIWNFPSLNPNETRVLSLPPVVGAGVAQARMIPWTARLLDDVGGQRWLSETLPIGTDPIGDIDGDGVGDAFDNCVIDANADQRDTDNDGYGNRCDADFNNDCVVNVVDLGRMRAVFFTDDPDADLDGDGVVNVTDLGLLRTLFFAPPGPSAQASVCN